jgi:hypothetical protein
MTPLKLFLIVPMLLSVPAFAQGTKGGGATTQSQTTVGRARTAVTIQSSTNNPFQNPIGQGAVPAASANSNRNGNWVNTSPVH